MSEHMTRRAFVTGGASGIGLACARRLSDDGLEVVIADLASPELERLAELFTGAAELDVRDADAVNAAISGWQPIDVLINSAGVVGPNAPVWEVATDGWEETIAINLTGTFNMIRAALPAMRERGWGRIINIASIAGKEGNPNLSAYSASKAGIIGLTKSVGKEVARDGILVNAVAPAVIETPMTAEIAPPVLEYMLSKIPMGRFGQPEEVAALVSWLASDECTFSTGHAYDISGGRATY